MNIATQISEAIAQKREHQTAIDNLDVRIAQLVASIPTPVDHSRVIEKLADAIREIQSGIDSQKDELDSISRQIDSVSSDLGSAYDSCDDALQLIEELTPEEADEEAA
jgi:chromosome segregation ATPase